MHSANHIHPLNISKKHVVTELENSSSGENDKNDAREVFYYNHNYAGGLSTRICGYWLDYNNACRATTDDKIKSHNLP